MTEASPIRIKGARRLRDETRSRLHSGGTAQMARISIVRFWSLSVLPLVIVGFPSGVANSAGIEAQLQGAPKILRAGISMQGTLTTASRKRVDETYYECWELITTRPGIPLTITMRSNAFDTYLVVFRGQDCTARSIAYFERDGEGNATVTFTPTESHYWLMANALYKRKRGNYTVLAVEKSGVETESEFQARVATARTLGDRTEAQRKAQVQAEALLTQNMPEAAKIVYQDALTTSPDWPQGHYNLALVYGSLKFYAQAIIEMRRYLFLEPNAADARAAQDQIYGWDALTGTKDAR